MHQEENCHVLKNAHDHLYSEPKNTVDFQLIGCERKNTDGKLL